VCVVLTVGRVQQSDYVRRLSATVDDDLTSERYPQWRRQDFVTGGGSEVWVYRGSRVRSPPVPVLLSVYQRGSLLDGLAMYLSCDTKKSHDNESTHILHNFWTSTHRGEASPFPHGGGTDHKKPYV